MLQFGFKTAVLHFCVNNIDGPVLFVVFCFRILVSIFHYNYHIYYGNSCILFFGT